MGIEQAGAPLSSAEVFQSGLREHRDHPPRGDDVIAAFAAHALKAVQNNEVLQHSLRTVAAARRLTPPHAGRLLEVGVQDLILHEPVLRADVEELRDYPESFQHHKAWAPVFERIFNAAEPGLADQLTHNMLAQNVGSNEPQHAIGAHLLAHLAPILGPVTVLDIGCSLNFCLKVLSLNGRPDAQGVGLRPVQIVDGEGHHLNWLTQRIDRFDRMPIRFAQGLGVDQLAPTEKRQRFVYASPYPRLLKAVLPQYQLMSKAHAPNVHFLQTDFMSNDPEEPSISEQLGALGFPNRTAKLVLVSNFLYQQRRDADRIRAIARAKKYVDPAEGFLIVQDYLQPNPNGGLDFTSDWQQPFEFRIMVYDPRSPDRTFREFFVAEDGACNTLKVGKDIGDILGSNFYHLIS